MKPLSGSIANRIFLILLAGIVLAGGTTSWLSGKGRSEALLEARNQHLADRIEQIVLAMDTVPPATRAQVLTVASNFGMDVRAVSTMPVHVNKADDSTPASLASLLQVQLGSDRLIGTARESDCTPTSAEHKNRTCQVIYASLADQTVLRLQMRGSDRSAAPRVHSPSTLYTPSNTILFLVLIALLAYLVSRMATRPIRQLATAANALGNDIDHPPLKEQGPTEIRQAARAFNAMQARIRRQIQHRTHMLAAVTHDLQTPLTRMRLRLEKVPDEELRHKLIDDLAVMHGLVREGLDLARSMDSVEPMQRMDIDSLLDSICADAADAGQQVSFSGQSQAAIAAQPNTLRRCLSNLIDNAVKYGQQAAVSVSKEPGHVAIRIRDNGPGIPQEQLDVVFDPFYRVETSRSRDTGGTGLGLTIARNIAENHRGTLVLRNHPDGGLEALLTLPLA